MADNQITAKILLRYDTYDNWMKSSVILAPGEPGICVFPNDTTIDAMSTVTPSYTPPAIGIKIGNGHKYFYQLPWVQGVAADVYGWAKKSSKPTYTANEISGLQSFIEDNFHISGDVTIAPRIYQITQGTGENVNKFYLRYKENNENAQWVIDTNNPIDLSAYQQVVEWIGTTILNNPNFPTLGTFNGRQIESKLATLDYTDSGDHTNKFVTSVTETDGKIEVFREQPNFSNLAGIAQVTQGGTGRNSLTEDTVLVGNGTNQIKLIPIAESIANNNYLVPNNVVKAYIDNAVAGLSGAMHFIGEATVVINNNSGVDPRITGYDFSSALAGDVILYDAKEFVWTGSSWHLLGDESSYAIKGAITDIDIADNAEISQSKIAGLSNTFDTKVDKEDNKQLSTEDFTTAFSNKLEGIEDGAQANIIEHILVNGRPQVVKTIENIPKSVDLEIKEFDDDSKQKLGTVARNAEVNKIEKIIYDGDELIPDENRIITITPDAHTEHENKIEEIFINNVNWEPNANKQVKITIDQAALNLNVLEGATVPGDNGARVDVTQVQKKLELEAIAVTGNIKHLKQTSDTYVILDCGTSTDVI